MPTLIVAEKVLSIINILIYITVVIVGLNVVWRVDQRLDKFIKVLVFAIALVPIRLMIEIAGFDTDPVWMVIMKVLGFTVGIVLLIAFAGFLKTVKQLNNEK
jgi:hypothetical protein